MSIILYDSLTRRKVPLTPLVPGKVSLYVCGPTVYDDCHIGHLMGPVLFDGIARWLQARGLDVRFVNNITDIDDKIIQRSLASGEPWQDITSRYTEQYLAQLRRLGVTTITDHPRCSDFIVPMIAMIGRMIAEDRAYLAGDGVYYAVERQAAYGKLSGRSLDEMQTGARIERRNDLRHPADFALWKLAKPGEPSWDSPWGAGRPGWHIECTVMSTKLLGGDFDIHGGGDDLKFPHHENEIAQAEACGCGYARHWMHNGLIQYGGVKISKSDPRMREPAFARQFTANWLLDTYGPAAIRFFLLQGHYRRPFDFEPRNIEAARAGLLRLLRQLGALAEAEDQSDDALTRPLPESLAERRTAFAAAMDDDFHSGQAISQLFTLAQDARHLNGPQQQQALLLLRDLGRLLGLFRPGEAASLAASTSSEATDDAALSAALALLIELRQEARAQRDFALSDRIRDQLAAGGIVLRDSRAGTSWERSQR